MSREYAEYPHARRRRRRRELHRVRGCLLAMALMIALGAYAGAGMAQQKETPAREPVGAVREPAASGEAGQPASDATISGDLEKMVSGVLEAIVTEEMTPLEQARAVFDYVHDNIRYTGNSDKSDWMRGAYTGLTAREGDCYTYYAVSRALLTALEIDNLPVEREGGETHHFWNLVNCGDGWYHFDACPRSSRLPEFFSFMVTDRQVADFTEEAGRNYYVFDKSHLPERATEIITEN